MKKMLKIFPLTSDVLKMAPAAIPANRDTYTGNQIRDLAFSFNYTDSIFLDQVVNEWTDFQLDDIGTEQQTAAEFWCQRTTRENFPSLSKVMLTLLCIPHSNASSERVFSVVKKIVTEQRSLLHHSTVNALLRVKMNEPRCCVDVKNFDHGALCKLKKATQVYNESLRPSASCSAMNPEVEVIPD